MENVEQESHEILLKEIQEAAKNYLKTIKEKSSNFSSEDIDKAIVKLMENLIKDLYVN